MASLKQKTVSGVKWQVANKVLQKGLSVVTFAILARILEPSMFGLFAMAFIIIDGFQIFKSFGIDSALVQRQDNIEEAAHTAVFIVQGTGILTAVACFMAAPFGAHFFHNPDVKTVIQALALVFVFQSFAKVPTTLLTKQMRFKVISIIELIGSVVNSVCAVTFALLSPTVWSLVWAYLVKQVVSAVLTRIYSGYRFKWRFDWKIARELVGYGKFIAGMGVLQFISGNLNNILTGKILGTTALGFWAVAQNIGHAANKHFLFAVTGVMFPAYASLQNDKEALKRAYFKTVKFTSLLSVPVTVVLIFLAREIVLTIYGEKWVSIVPVIQLLSVVQFLTPLFAIPLTLFMACGKPKYNFRFTLASLLIDIPMGILFAQKMGIIGIAAWSITSHAIFVVVATVMIRNFVRFSVMELVAQFRTAVFGAGCMSAVIFIAKHLSRGGLVFQDCWLSHAVTLLFFVLLSVLTYGLAFYYADRLALSELKKMFIRPAAA